MPPPTIPGVTFGGPIDGPTVPGVVSYYVVGTPGPGYTYQFVYAWVAKRTVYCDGQPYLGQSPSAEGSAFGVNTITACSPSMTVSLTTPIASFVDSFIWSPPQPTDPRLEIIPGGAGSFVLFRTLAGGSVFYVIGSGDGYGFGTGPSDAALLATYQAFPTTQNEAYYISADTRCGTRPTLVTDGVTPDCDAKTLTLTGTNLNQPGVYVSITAPDGTVPAFSILSRTATTIVLQLVEVQTGYYMASVAKVEG